MCGIVDTVDINALQEHNPWWRRPEFILEDNYILELERQKYLYYHPLYQSLPIDKDSVLTLRGPRRIGKTTLLKLLVKRLLLQDKVEKENVFFFPCDTLKDFKELEDLFLLYLNFLRPKSSKRVFIFLDEISFIKEWQRTVKLLVDAGKLKNALVLITGSNILDLKFSAERLPGRRGDVFPWDITFLPLTFHEFISLIEPSLLADLPSLSLPLLPKFQKLFNDFLLCGGFPTTINEYFAKGYISSQSYEIFLAWIEGDLHRAGKAEFSAYQIISRLFAHLTSQTSYYRLSRESGIASHITVEEYLEVLEKMFILFRLPYFSLEEGKIYPRKNGKFYFTDPFVFNLLKAKTAGFSQGAFPYCRDFINNTDNRPMLVENTLAGHLWRNFSTLYFGRASDDREIDFIGLKEGKRFYFEAKYQKRVALEDFLWTRNVLGKRRLTVITQKDFLEGDTSLIPAEIFFGHFQPSA